MGENPQERINGNAQEPSLLKDYVVRYERLYYGLVCLDLKK